MRAWWYHSNSTSLPRRWKHIESSMGYDAVSVQIYYFLAEHWIFGSVDSANYWSRRQRFNGKSRGCKGKASQQSTIPTHVGDFPTNRWRVGCLSLVSSSWHRLRFHMVVMEEDGSSLQSTGLLPQHQIHSRKHSRRRWLQPCRKDLEGSWGDLHFLALVH